MGADGDEDSQQTHLHVKQEVAVVQNKDHLYALSAMLDREITASPKDYKIILFFNTARAAQVCV